MTFSDYINGAVNIVDTIIALLMAAGLVVFLWGLFKFMTKAGDAGAVEQGRNTMVWGIIALFVMVTIWGIIKFLGGELEIGAPGGSVPLQK